MEYFHVVFTVPEPIAAIALYNPSAVYGILFRAAAQTLLAIAADRRHLGAALGFFAILHTWGQNLLHHPHLHCVVPGGGLSPDHQRWIACRPGFFLPVRVLSRLFRRLFLEALHQAFHLGRLQFPGELAPLADPTAFARHLAPAAQSEWVVHAKPPFGGPQQVLEYLGRYTHRVAISNRRLRSLEHGHVSFEWKDYRHQRKRQSKVMTLTGAEFTRRFLLHVLPPGFQRIRHFGFLANCHRRGQLALCRQLLAAPLADLLPAPRDYRDLYQALTATSLRRCPCCGQGEMIRIRSLPDYRWPQLPPPDSSRVHRQPSSVPLGAALPAVPAAFCLSNPKRPSLPHSLRLPPQLWRPDPSSSQFHASETQSHDTAHLSRRRFVLPEPKNDPHSRAPSCGLARFHQLAARTVSLFPCFVVRKLERPFSALHENS